MTTSHALTSKAMTANMTVGMWMATRLDKGASAELTVRAGAKPDAARVNKHLIDKEALAPIVRACGALRTHFHEHTMPWKDNGDRILTRKMFTTFIERHNRLAEQFEAAVDHFVRSEYPKEIQRAAFRMGSMFKPEDYPEPIRLRGKFYVVLGIDAITTSGDFRVELDDATVAKVRAEIDTASEHRVKAAMADIWERLVSAVSHAQSRLSDPEQRFQSTTLTNVSDLLVIADAMNLTDDPNLTSICHELDQIFGSVSATDIRKDASMRSAVATEAEEIVEKMKGFAAVFNPS
jgi:hypothetical protein